MALPTGNTRFAGKPLFSVRFRIEGDPLVWRGWSKEIMLDLGRTVEQSVKDRVTKGSQDHRLQRLPNYKTNVGRNPATRGRKGKPIVLVDTGRMMRFWKAQRASKTRVRITSSKKERYKADFTNAKYQWAFLDPNTMRRLTDRFHFWVDRITSYQEGRMAGYDGGESQKDLKDWIKSEITAIPVEVLLKSSYPPAKAKRVKVGEPVFL